MTQNFTTTKIFHTRFKLQRNFSKISTAARVMGRNVQLFHVQKFGFTAVFNNSRFFRPDCPTDQPIGMIDPPRALSVQALHFGPKKSSLNHNPAPGSLGKWPVRDFFCIFRTFKFLTAHRTRQISSKLYHDQYFLHMVQTVKEFLKIPTVAWVMGRNVH